MAKKLKLGIIGESYGNGHPFSWSAIFNGYDLAQMELCGYPTIPRYLEKQSWPEATLKLAKVTSIWTQDKERSKLISLSTNIPNICNYLNQISEEVDGILLARDDAENHIKHALPALNKGIPIFIDKPLALNTKDALYLFSLANKSLLFSCSCLRYDPDLDISSWWGNVNLNCIEGIAPKRWETYSIHAIEPIIASYQKYLKINGNELMHILSKINFIKEKKDQSVILKMVLPKNENLSPIDIRIITTGSNTQPIQIKAFDSLGYCMASKKHKNSFLAFRNTLGIFEKSLITKNEPLDRETMLSSVYLVERGLQ